MRRVLRWLLKRFLKPRPRDAMRMPDLRVSGTVYGETKLKVRPWGRRTEQAMYIDQFGHVTTQSVMHDRHCINCGAVDTPNASPLSHPCPKKACPTCLNEFDPDEKGNCKSCAAIGRVYLGNR